jgi:hypothetical protein
MSTRGIFTRAASLGHPVWRLEPYQGKNGTNWSLHLEDGASRTALHVAGLDGDDIEQLIDACHTALQSTQTGREEREYCAWCYDLECTCAAADVDLPAPAGLDE